MNGCFGGSENAFEEKNTTLFSPRSAWWEWWEWRRNQSKLDTTDVEFRFLHVTRVTRGSRLAAWKRIPYVNVHMTYAYM
jgi:hypothetical protein